LQFTYRPPMILQMQSIDLSKFMPKKDVSFAEVSILKDDYRTL
jgi:hypothetical protein